MPLLLRSEEHTSELQSPCNLVCLFRSDRKSTRLNSSHLVISYAVFCLKKKKTYQRRPLGRPPTPHPTAPSPPRAASRRSRLPDPSGCPPLPGVHLPRRLILFFF